jgi:hypothetical protein
MDQLDKQILALNGLSYQPSEELSLCSSHRIRHFPCLSQVTEQSQSFYVDVSVGSDLISPMNSWLSFDLQIATADGTPVELPSNGVLSLFRELIVRSRSGMELDRIRNLNIFTHDFNVLEYQYGINETIGSAMFQGAQLANNSVTRVAIPMSWLCPLFRSDKLLPTSQIGNLRFEFLLDTAATALITTADTTANFNIRNVEISVDTFSLADSALRSLQMMASESGLAYEWESISTTVSKSSGNAANLVSLKSASRALGTFVHISTTADLTNQNANSMANQAYDVESSQFSLGSAYFPVKPIQSSVENYLNTLYSCDSLGHPREYAPQLSFAEYKSQYGVIASTLERSNTLQANGSAVSASRPLVCQVQWNDPGERTTFLFLRYQRLLLAYSDSNVLIKE